MECYRDDNVESSPTTGNPRATQSSQAISARRGRVGTGARAVDGGGANAPVEGRGDLVLVSACQPLPRQHTLFPELRQKSGMEGVAGADRIGDLHLASRHIHAATAEQGEGALRSPGHRHQQRAEAAPPLGHRLGRLARVEPFQVGAAEP